MILGLLAVQVAAPEPPVNWAVLVFGLLGSIGSLGGLGALVYARSTGKKLNAEAHKYGVDADVALSGQALEWLRETRAESAEAKAESSACRRELDALKDHVTDVLEPMMRQAGMTPPPFVWKKQ